MKTSELKEELLDYWVGKAEDLPLRFDMGRNQYYFVQYLNDSVAQHVYYSPSTDWAVGGPLIEREGIATRKHKKTGVWYALSLDDAGDNQCMDWVEFTARGGKRYGPMSYQVDKRLQRYSGKTQLIAAMRCIVAAKFGEEVE